MESPLFQYIPCYGLSIQRKNALYISIVISIHPMLRFIGCYSPSEIKGYAISIHPMLRFISGSLVFLNELIHFNTSHVTVYQKEATVNWFTFHYFNTSHVTVYPEKSSTTPNTSIFQYIPCYGLSGGFYVYIIKRKHISIHPMLRFIFFNPHHV